MTLRTLLAATLLTALTPVAQAVLIHSFPGLDKAIEQAEIIAVVRIDEHIQPARDDNLLTRHRCMVYQTLKGNLKPGETVPLILRDTRTSFVSPFPLHSTHLVFLIRTNFGYQNLTFEGSILRMSPFGHEKAPDGDTLQAKIKNLVSQSVSYWDGEWSSERRFLEEITE